jgi:hypothetical protein
MTCREVWSRKTRTRIFDGLGFMSNNQILLDLSESKCSNHIGVSTLAFTRDGKMVVTVQSASSAQSAGLLAPSGSGSADLEDLQQAGNDFHTFLTRAMERELLEECGLANAGAGLVRTRLIGYARLLDRGGKPEFFGVSLLDVPFATLRVTGKEAVFIADIMDIRVNQAKRSEFESALNRFRREHQAGFSFLLSLQLQFLVDTLQASPDSLMGLLGPPA